MYAIYWANGDVSRVATFQKVKEKIGEIYPERLIDYEQNDPIRPREKKSWTFFFTEAEDDEDNIRVVAEGKTDDYDYPVINL